MVVVVVVTGVAEAGLGAVWAWILAQADIAATNTAISRECLGVYFIVWGVVRSLLFAWAGISGQAMG